MHQRTFTQLSVSFKHPYLPEIDNNYVITMQPTLRHNLKPIKRSRANVKFKKS